MRASFTLRTSLLLACLLLVGCGKSYTITVDSLRDTASTAQTGRTYCIQPSDGTAKDDLLFREIKRLLVPAFAAQGFQVAASCDAADAVALVSYATGTPEVRLSTDTVTRYVPVVLRRNGRKYVENVPVEERQITATTLYRAHMLVEGRKWHNNTPGMALWRTEAHSTSTEEDYRSHLTAMAKVLQTTLSLQMPAQQSYDVTIEDDGKITVSQDSF